MKKIREDDVFIKALNKEEATSNYKDAELHPISIKPSYGRITGKNLIRNVCQVFPLDFTKKTFYKFKSEWDPINKYLKVGENVIEVILGDGWINQTTIDTWDFYKAPWRSDPKLLFELFL